MLYLVSKKPPDSNKFKVISAEESLALLSQCKILQYDSETDGVCPQLCKLLSIQFGNEERNIQIVVDATTIDIKKYKNIIENTWLVGHNLKFDISFLYNYGIVPLNVYDTMIVEQFLHLGYPPGSISYSLKSILKQRFDIEIDKTVRGQIIWRGLDEDVVLYAAKDVYYLEKLMRSQILELKDKGAIEGGRLECLFVPVIAYLEWCGIKLDVNKWKAKMEKDKTDYEIYKEALNQFVVSDTNLKQFTYIDTQGDLFTGFNLKPVCTLNWASSQQVVELVKLLGFNTTVTDKKTGEDKDSVLEKVLKVQKGINDEFLDLYFKYKEKEKVITSFGQGHLNAVNPNTGRIYTIYRQLGAASGRMSCGSNQPNEKLAQLKGVSPKDCSFPNMQQLPHDEETRSAFVAEEGNLFCSCDYSALESRLGADIYQESTMLKEFLEGSGDMHSLCAKMVFKEELKDVPISEIKKKRPDLRSRVKSVEFAKQFGGSANAIAGSLGCSIEEAQKFSNFYDQGFKGVTDFKNKGSKFVRENGYVLINPITNHKMYWYGWEQWKEQEDYYNSSQWSWDNYKKNHKNTGDLIAQQVKEHYKIASKWDRMALNAPTQGSGSVILKSAMTDFFHWIVKNNYFNIIKLCALVHDEACIEYPKTIKDVDKKLVSCMEEAAAKYCKSLPIPAEASIGDHWIH